MYRWIILLHVISAFVFFTAHGVSIGVALWVRRERLPERLRPLLELSDASRMVLHPSLAGILISGIVGGFIANWWHMGWIWVSLALMVVVTLVMVRGVSPYFNRLRKAVDSPYREAGKHYPAQEAASGEEIEALLNSAQMLPMVVTGLLILAVIVYLMMFKPF